MTVLRDLTKSVTSYTWAMSVYGVQQMLNMLNPGKAAESFETVTAAAVNEMGGAMKDAFRVGDRIQRGMVDMMMAGMGMWAMDPSRIMNGASSAMRQTMDATQRAAQGMADATQRATGSATPGFQSAPPRQSGNSGRASEAQTNPPGPGPAVGSTQPSGWGPMPK
jgi:hypothetical protein